MSYSTYTTEALVCGTWDRNTADKSYLLFTKNAGMLYADARSAREEKSKQRFGLQDFSYIRVSLIKGKNGWRIGSVEPVCNHYADAIDKAGRGSVVMIYRWLRRFYKGEESDPLLFVYLLAGLEVLGKTVTDRAYLERLIQLRVLYDLGYVDTKQAEAFLVKTITPDLTASPKVTKSIDDLLDIAIDTSHL